VVHYGEMVDECRYLVERCCAGLEGSKGVDIKAETRMEIAFSIVSQLIPARAQGGIGQGITGR